MHATLYEAQARVRHQVLHGTGDEHLGGAGGCSDPGADVDGDGSDVVVHQLALARVEPGPDLDPQRTDPVADGAGATDRPRRAIEGCEEAVRDGVCLTAPMPFEFPPDDPVVRVEDRQARSPSVAARSVEATMSVKRNRRRRLTVLPTRRTV